MKTIDSPRKRNLYDWILEIMTLCAGIASIYPILFNSLPHGTQIPIHYNYRGVANGWIDISNSWIFIALPILLYIFLSFMERYYKKFNYGIKKNISDDSRPHLYRLGVRVIRHIKLIVTLMFFYTNNNFMGVFYSDSMNINPIVNFVFQSAIVSLIFISIVLLRKYKHNKF